jgi:DNA-binding XRE family transcriptional regulator
MRNDQAAPSSEPEASATQSRVFDDKFASKLLARNVRHFRTNKNYSQDTLATKCGIFRTYLSRIETGKCNPSLSVLVALAGALDVSPHILLTSIE